MASDVPMKPDQMTDQALALWMLDRIRDSEEFLGVIQAARLSGIPDVLDTPHYMSRHRTRLKRLFQDDEEDAVDVPAGLAGTIDALIIRDGLSSAEELIEKAIAAYIERHPRGREGLPPDGLTTFRLARSEIEGKSTGAFRPGFVAGLASLARDELARVAAADRARNQGQEHDQ